MVKKKENKELSAEDKEWVLEMRKKIEKMRLECLDIMAKAILGLMKEINENKK